MPIDKRRVLFEDQWLLAVTKLGGELVVKGKGRIDKLPLLDFLKKQYPALFPIHRLDFETSGVVVFAKTRKTLKTIVESKFAGWNKVYVALVSGIPREPNGTIDIPLPARMGSGNVPASTKYRVLDRFRGCSLVECKFERGQRHQIRRHLAMIGNPLILDSVYGDEKVNRSFSKFLKMHRFFLHAKSVEFPHPSTGAAMKIESPVPDVFEKVLGALKNAK